MTSTQWLLIGIIVVPLLLVVFNRLRMDLAAILMAALLGFLQFFGVGLLGAENTPADAVQAIAGFSKPVVITLISLFIVTRSLEKTGVTRWITRQILRYGGNKPANLIALFATVTALLSLFMNNLAAGALLLPSAMETARRTDIKPSRLLIPVAYGSLLGGAATYFTTANIIVSDLLRIANPPQAALNILDFTPTGGLIALAGILFLWLFGARLLPDREPPVEHGSARFTGSDLEQLYQIHERLWEARIPTSSPLVSQSIAETGLGAHFGISVAAIRSSANALSMPEPAYNLHAGDTLYLVGREDKIRQIDSEWLDIREARLDSLSPQGIRLYEIILSPHSGSEGKTLAEIDFRRQFGLTAIALKRMARSYRTDVAQIPMSLGDSLLVVGDEEHIRLLRRNRDFIIIEPDPGDQPLDKKRATLSAGITLAAIATSIAGVPVYLSMLTGAMLILLLKIVSPEEAYRSVEWQAVFLIAGMVAVSQALVNTGLAALLGSRLISLAAPFGSLGIAAGAYLFTALLTQVLGGQVAALVTGPITISAAISMGVNPQAVAVATAIGCSASFLTPIAHPVNILMVAPGNYKFSDFFKIGLPLTVLSFLALLAGLKLFWGM